MAPVLVLMLIIEASVLAYVVSVLLKGILALHPQTQAPCRARFTIR
jgi:hypothetical protein